VNFLRHELRQAGEILLDDLLLERDVGGADDDPRIGRDPRVSMAGNQVRVGPCRCRREPRSTGVSARSGPRSDRFGHVVLAAADLVVAGFSVRGGPPGSENTWRSSGSSIKPLRFGTHQGARNVVKPVISGRAGEPMSRMNRAPGRPDRAPCSWGRLPSPRSGPPGPRPRLTGSPENRLRPLRSERVFPNLTFKSPRAADLPVSPDHRRYVLVEEHGHDLQLPQQFPRAPKARAGCSMRARRSAISTRSKAAAASGPRFSLVFDPKFAEKPVSAT